MSPYQRRLANPYRQPVTLLDIVKSEESQRALKNYIDREGEKTITVKLPESAFLIREPPFGSLPIYYKLFIGDHEPLRLKTRDRLVYELDVINQTTLDESS